MTKVSKEILMESKKALLEQVDIKLPVTKEQNGVHSTHDAGALDGFEKTFRDADSSSVVVLKNGNDMQYGLEDKPPFVTALLAGFQVAFGFLVI